MTDTAFTHSCFGDAPLPDWPSGAGPTFPVPPPLAHVPSATADIVGGAAAIVVDGEERPLEPGSLGLPPYLNGPPEVRIYEHSVEVDRPKPEDWTPPDPPEKRGEVTEFSRKSRRRLIQKMMKVESSRLCDPVFLTLTWHKEWKADHDEVQRQLNAFLQAVRRKWEDYEYIWRLEFQKRGAPHIHMILWRPAGSKGLDANDVEKWASETWHRITEEPSAHHKEYGADCRQITSWREASAYVSKYCAKLEKRPQIEYTGRRWAASQSLPTDPVSSHVADLPYIHQLRRILRRWISSQDDPPSGFVEALKRDQSYHVGGEAQMFYRLLYTIEEDHDHISPHRRIRDGPSPAQQRRKEQLEEAALALRCGETPAERRSTLPPLTHREEPRDLAPVQHAEEGPLAPTSEVPF